MMFTRPGAEAAAVGAEPNVDWKSETARRVTTRRSALLRPPRRPEQCLGVAPRGVRLGIPEHAGDFRDAILAVDDLDRAGRDAGPGLLGDDEMPVGAGGD